MDKMQEFLEQAKQMKDSLGPDMAMDFSPELIRRIAPTESEREIFARKWVEICIPPEAPSEVRDAAVNAFLNMINNDEWQMEDGE